MIGPVIGPVLDGTGRNGRSDPSFTTLVSVSRASIAKATDCLDEGLINGDDWDREFDSVDGLLYKLR